MSLYHMGCQIEDDPSDTKMLVETLNLPIKELPPTYGTHSGWRIMTGNVTYNLWARVVYRYEVEE